MAARSIPLAGLVALFVSSLAGAAEHYVSPGGDDGNSGTESKLFASLARGQEAAAPGDTVWIGGGEYVFEGGGQRGQRSPYYLPVVSGARK